MKLSHAEAQALVSARLDGPLDPVAERELNAHLATCDSCRAFNISSTQLARGLQTMPRLSPSPAVTRAVLEHVATPRSGWIRLLGSLPENTLPVASAVAAAVVVLFIGAFGTLRWLEDDEPSVIPALTEAVFDLAQQSVATETADVNETQLAAPTDEPTARVALLEETESNTLLAPTEHQVTESAPSEAVGQTVPPTEKSGDGGTSQTEEPTTRQSATEASTEEPALEPTEEGDKGGGDDSNSTESARFVLPGDSTPGNPSTQDVVPTETTEPESTDVPPPVSGQTDESTPTDDGVQEIGPSGQSIVAEPTDEPAPTDEPTLEPSPTDEPAPTDEPTLEPSPTDEPTLEPTPTDEPAPTDEPTLEPTPTDEPTLEPSPTDEPTTEPLPTDVPIISRDETPESPPIDQTPDDDNGTGAATTAEATTDLSPTIGSLDQEATADDIQEIGPPGGDDVIEQPSEETEFAPDNDPSGGNESLPAGTGSADVSLGTAPEYMNLAEVPGEPGADGARLGVDADNQLIYARNPGRVSLVNQNITLQAIETETGQSLGVCLNQEDCIDASSATKSGGELDTPIGWIGEQAIYERLYGADYPVEFRAITIDPSTGQVLADESLGGGGTDSDWETLVRPYPVDGGLLVPAPGVWLHITPNGVTELGSNPYGSDLSFIRVNPSTGIVSYVTGSTLVLASLEQPGVPLAEMPFNASDYDFSPDGTQVALITGDGIEIQDLEGNLVTSFPNPEGIAVGSLTWLNEGLVYADLSNGVLRILVP